MELKVHDKHHNSTINAHWECSFVLLRLVHIFIIYVLSHHLDGAQSDVSLAVSIMISFRDEGA